MNILFISPSAYPNIGGVETHVNEVSKILSKKGHRVKIISGEQIKYPEIKFLGLFVIWLWFLKNLRIITRSDLVHAHDVFIWYLPLRFLLPKKPVFVTFHGYETKFPPTLSARIIRKISEKLAWGNISVGDYIKKWYGTKPTFVTYGGINLHKYRATVRGSYVRIVFIGRLEKDTGVPIYLKALEILKTKSIDFNLEVCGDGSLRNLVERYGTVHGFVKNLDAFLARSDLVFASSYLSIVEALAYKKPVFAVFDNPLKKDYLKLSPFAKFIEISDNAEDLATRITVYLKNSFKMINNINAGYKWVKENPWEKVADIYLKLWKI